MKRSIWLILAALIFLTTANATHAQANQARFAYVPNLGSDSVSGYTIDPTTGALAPVPGSPFPAGARPVSVTIDPTSRFVYVANLGVTPDISGSISAYTIDASTGSLTPIPGSPFPVLSGTGVNSASIDPTGKFLYATVFAFNFGAVLGFAIDANSGALTPIPGSPFAQAQGVSLVALHPNGKFAYVREGAVGGPTVIAGFAIDSTSGALSPVPGSPFPAGSSNGLFPITLNMTGSFAYVPNSSGDVSAFVIDATTGTLTPTAGSPFPAILPISVTVDPTNKFAYVVDNSCGFPADGTITAFTIDGLSGALAQIDSPFSAGACTQSMAIDPTGRFAYVVDLSRIFGYSIDPVTGVLSALPGSPFPGGLNLSQLTIDPSGKFTYAASKGASAVQAYSINGGTGALTPVLGSPFLAGTDPQSVTLTERLPPINSMNDDFSGTSIDPSRWHVLTPPPGFAASVSETNQRLEIAEGAASGGGGIVSNCSVTGDFDAQVDYALLNWPPDNKHNVRLGAADLTGAPGINRSSFSSELYVLSLASGSFQTPTTDLSGKLRLVRRGSALFAYFFRGGGWLLVGSGTVSTGATRFNLDLGSGDPTAPGGVSVAFENFRVNAGSVSCSSLPPPSITAVSPASGPQGQTIPNFTVNGTGFDSNATVSFTGFDIKVNAYFERTATQIVASITIAAGAAPSAHDVMVTNPDGHEAIERVAFSVTLFIPPVEQPDIGVSPNSLDFGTEALHDQITKNISVQNTGTGRLLVTAVNSTESSFTAFPTSFALDPGQFLAISVTFSPISPGTKNAILKIVSNATTSAVFVTTTGVGATSHVGPVILVPSHDVSPSHPLYISASNIRPVAHGVMANITITNVTGAWYELDLHSSPSGPPFPIPIQKQIPFAFLIGPFQQSIFTDVQFPVGDYLQFDAKTTSLSASAMFGIDMVVRAVFGVQLNLVNGILNISQGVVGEFLSSIGSNCTGAGVAFNFSTATDVWTLIGDAAQFMGCTVSNPQVKQAVLNLLPQLYGNSIATNWIQIGAGTAEGVVFAFTHVPEVVALGNQELTANPRGFVRLDALRP